MLATIMQALDTTIANVALPYMQGSLSATAEQINWVLTSYIVAAAIMTAPVGWLAARFGRRRLFLVCVAGFTVTSMLCGAAMSLEEIVLARVLQGMFGAALVPLSQAVMLDSYARSHQGQAMAVWGMGVMLGPILGPTIGGWLTEAYSWRWVFYVNLPVGVLAFLGLWAFLDEHPSDRSMRFDWFGFALLGLAVGSLQMMLDRGEQLDWFGSTEIVVECVAAGLGFYLFVVHMLTAERPFLDPRLFRDRNFVGGVVLMFMVGIILLSTIALLSPYLQNLMGYPVLTAGLVMGPRGIGTLVAMMVVGRLVNRLDPRFLILAGLLLIALSLWEMTAFTPDIGAWTLVRTGATQGFGLGLVFVPLSTASFATLAPRWRTDGAALISLGRNIGSAIGISFMAFMLSHNTQVMHASLVAHVTPFNAAASEGAAATFWSTTTPAGRAALDAEVTRQAQIVAYMDDFKLMMLLSLAVAPLVLLMRRPPDHGPGRPLATAAD